MNGNEETRAAAGEETRGAESEINGQSAQQIAEKVAEALKDEQVKQQAVFNNDELVNEVIERYLRSLAVGAPVPSVRGLSALTPVRKPKTLTEAKAIVDGK